MKRYLILPLLLLCTGLMLSSCDKEKISADNPDYSEAQLRAGTWTVNQVALNSFDSEGFLISSEVIPFGENKEGGICTFTYDDKKNFTMVDNGTIFATKFEMVGRLLNMSNGDTWGIREMNEDYLEVALRGERVNNPCNYSESGAVYYLSRNNH